MSRPNTARRHYRVAEDDDGRRVDRVVRKLLPELPLGAVYRLIRTGAIRLDDRKVSQRSRVRRGQTLSVPAGLARPSVASTSRAAPSPRSPRADNPPSDFAPLIIAETDHYVAISKPKGALVHGPGGLDEAVRTYLAGRIEMSLSFQPGPVHRLDRNTSGLLLFSKSLLGAQVLGSAILEARKHYLGIVDGAMEATVEWTDPLARSQKTRKTAVSPTGKPAHTTAEPLLASAVERGGGDFAGRHEAPAEYTLVRFTLHTGRTHQIRAHASAHGNPLAGDRKYGGSPLAGGYVLHAWEIVFVGGRDESERHVLDHPCLSAPPPRAALASLFDEDKTITALKRSRTCTEGEPFTTL